MAAVKFTQLGQGEFIFTIPEAFTLGEGVIRVAIIYTRGGSNKGGYNLH